jgi:hypothetical protein
MSAYTKQAVLIWVAVIILMACFIAGEVMKG